MEQVPAPFSIAPDWSITLGSVGRVLVLLGIACFAASLLGWLLSAKFEKAKFAGKWGFVSGAICVFGTFVVLATLFANNRFEYPYIYGHGDKQNALAYRIAGVWSGQEGSFLLWAVTSSIFGLLTARGTGIYRRWFTVFYALFLGSLCGILAFESPFRIEQMHGHFIVPPDGAGLAPSLQNYWVIVHPPTIFMGFGSLTVLFCYALSALIIKQPIEWAKRVRPWALVSLTLVGVGLCMGGLWAYETLNWGGFWKWDPVENTSFVPFILTAIFVHGLIVQINRGKWMISNLLLGGLPFLAFLYGTFLTRSGFLGETTVHGFAEMKRAALWLLVALGGSGILGFLAVWTVRAVQMRKDLAGSDSGKNIHRVATYRWASILLFGLALATGFGMSVPILSTILGIRLQVVEEPEYHQVVPWFAIPILIVMAAAPYIAWGGVGFRRLFERLYGPACVAFGLTGLTLLSLMYSPWSKLGPFEDKVPLFFTNKLEQGHRIEIPSLTWSLILAGFCYFVVTSSLWTIAERWKSSKEAVSIFLMHIGVGVLLAGLILSRGLERKEITLLQKSKPAFAMGYRMTFAGMTHDLFDKRNQVLVKMEPLDSNGQKKSTQMGMLGGISDSPEYEATPGLYYMMDQSGNPNPMAWPSIRHGLLSDLYLTMHPIAFEATDPVTLKVGQETTFEHYLIKYTGMTREGEPGAMGTKFGAKIIISDDEGHARDLIPKFKITEQGPVYEPVIVDEQYQIRLVRMNAADKSAVLQWFFNEPVYPIELFYKPFTSLVWGGLGILCAGGFLAAWHRRFRPKKAGAAPAAETAAE